MLTNPIIRIRYGLLEAGATHFEIGCPDHGVMVNEGHSRFRCEECGKQVYIEVW